MTHGACSNKRTEPDPLSLFDPCAWAAPSGHLVDGGSHGRSPGTSPSAKLLRKRRPYYRSVVCVRTHEEHSFKEFFESSFELGC